MWCASRIHFRTTAISAIYKRSAQVLKKLIFRIFADDRNIFYSSNNLEQLQTVINEEPELVLKYCAANKLSIDFKKTNFMIITTPKKKVNIRITACNIEQKSLIKYLGVFIDEHLKWDAQLQNINNKLTKNIRILYKLRHYVYKSTIKQLYYALMYPYLNYGLISWVTACQTKLNKIEIRQNKCIRSIFFCKQERKLNTILCIITNSEARERF